jgi:hypothetical protein
LPGRGGPPLRSAAREALERRLAPRPHGFLDIVSTLRHFAIVTWPVPPERMAPHLPDRFELELFEVDGRPAALVSAVPFIDEDFHFARLLPFVKLRFGQTNYRAYVKDRASGERVVWFFGTSLSSWTVWPARLLWRIPWHHARYRTIHDFDEASGRYRAFRYAIASRWCDTDLDLVDSGEPVTEGAGFGDEHEWRLVLTHPVEGFFRRLDGRLGTYSVSHDVLGLTRGEARTAYVSLFERLGLLSRAEMERPHSVLLCPRTVFHIHMPPRAVIPGLRAR